MGRLRRRPMLSSKVTATIRTIKLRTQKDDPGVWIDLSLEFEPQNSHYQDLGDDVVALVESAKVSDTRGVPFTEVKLGLEAEGLRFVIATPSGGERVSALGVRAKKWSLVRDDAHPSRPLVRLQVTLPPLERAAREYLIDNLNHDVIVGLSYTQTDLFADEDTASTEPPTGSASITIEMEEDTCVDCGEVTQVHHKSRRCLRCAADSLRNR